MRYLRAYLAALMICALFAAAIVATDRALDFFR